VGKITFQGMGTTRIIAIPSSRKSHFGLGRRQKMNKQGQAPKWNLSFSTSRKSHFLMVKNKKMKYDK
jgi:hypothetical protein